MARRYTFPRSSGYWWADGGTVYSEAAMAELQRTTYAVFSTIHIDTARQELSMNLGSPEKLIPLTELIANLQTGGKDRVRYWLTRKPEGPKQISPSGLPRVMVDSMNDYYRQLNQQQWNTYPLYSITTSTTT